MWAIAGNKNSSVLAIKIGVAVALAGLILNACHNWGVYWRDHSVESPVGCFRETFDTAPDAGITRLHGTGYAFRDDEYVFLAFHTTEPTFLHLLGSEFHSVTRRKFREKSPTSGGAEGSLPSWWTPLAGHSTIFLFSPGFHPSYARGKAYAAYDPVTQQASVYWSGSD